VQPGTSRPDHRHHENPERPFAAQHRRRAGDTRARAGGDAGVGRIVVVQQYHHSARARSLDADAYDPQASSVAKAYAKFADAGRMKPSANFDRIVDVMEKLVRLTLLLRSHAAHLVDRYSERKEAGILIDPATDLSSIATAPQATRL
jgi:hypothetical protein